MNRLFLLCAILSGCATTHTKVTPDTFARELKIFQLECSGHNGHTSVHFTPMKGETYENPDYWEITITCSDGTVVKKSLLR